MASSIAKDIRIILTEDFVPTKGEDPRDKMDALIDDRLAPVRKALSDTNRRVAHELYPELIDEVRLALDSLEPGGR